MKLMISIDRFSDFSCWKPPENGHNIIWYIPCINQPLPVLGLHNVALVPHRFHPQVLPCVLSPCCVVWVLGWVVTACIWPCWCCCHHSPACNLVMFQFATDSHMHLQILIGSSQVTWCTSLGWPGPLRLDNKHCPSLSIDAGPSPASLLSFEQSPYWKNALEISIP